LEDYGVVDEMESGVLVGAMLIFQFRLGLGLAEDRGGFDEEGGRVQYRARGRCYRELLIVAVFLGFEI